KSAKQFPLQRCRSATYNIALLRSARADLPIQFPSVGYKTMSLARSVSAIVPARDEQATIARAVLSLAAQPEIGEIIVINDQSTDGTRAILEELAASVPKLRSLETQQLPAGWVGKDDAVWMGAA